MFVQNKSMLKKGILEFKLFDNKNSVGIVFVCCKFFFLCTVYFHCNSMRTWIYLYCLHMPLYALSNTKLTVVWCGKSLELWTVYASYTAHSTHSVLLIVTSAFSFKDQQHERAKSVAYVLIYTLLALIFMACFALRFISFFLGHEFARHSLNVHLVY